MTAANIVVFRLSLEISTSSNDTSCCLLYYPANTSAEFIIAELIPSGCGLAASISELFTDSGNVIFPNLLLSGVNGTICSFSFQVLSGARASLLETESFQIQLSGCTDGTVGNDGLCHDGERTRGPGSFDAF